jgi:hypothetical protein
VTPGKGWISAGVGMGRAVRMTWETMRDGVREVATAKHSKTTAASACRYNCRQSVMGLCGLRPVSTTWCHLCYPNKCPRPPVPISKTGSWTQNVLSALPRVRQVLPKKKPSDVNHPHEGIDHGHKPAGQGECYLARQDTPVLQGAGAEIG